MKSDRNILITFEPDRRYTEERVTNQNQTKTSKSYNSEFKRKENKLKYKYLIPLKCNLSNEIQISNYKDSNYKKIFK